VQRYPVDVIVDHINSPDIIQDTTTSRIHLYKWFSTPKWPSTSLDFFYL